MFDPLSEKYLANSAYNSFGNNPILYLDIDGREIIIGENGEKYTYVKDRKFDPNISEFQKNTTLALDKLYESGAMKITIGEGKTAITIDVLSLLINSDSKTTIVFTAAGVPIRKPTF